MSFYSVYDWRHFNVPDPQYVDYVFSVKLIALTSKAYAYYRALNILEWEDYDPVFMNPVKLPSNVTGGGGIQPEVLFIQARHPEIFIRFSGGRIEVTSGI